MKLVAFSLFLLVDYPIICFVCFASTTQIFVPNVNTYAQQFERLQREQPTQHPTAVRGWATAGTGWFSLQFRLKFIFTMFRT